MLILATSHARGIVHVDTMALDGETNLKEKQTPLEHLPFLNLQDTKFLGSLQGSVFADSPNESLESWEGFVQLPKEELVHCSIKHLLLRGSTVKNTEFVLGVVIYAGKDTKILQNSKHPPHKVSNVMNLMNKMLITVFVFQLAMIVLCGVLNYLWYENNSGTQLYTNLTALTGTERIASVFIQLLTFWVAFSDMIPISLYVAIEVLKMCLVVIFNRDVRMVYEGLYGNCRNSDLIEELG